MIFILLPFNSSNFLILDAALLGIQNYNTHFKSFNSGYTVAS